VHLLSYAVKCAVTNSPFNTQANRSKCPPTAWMHFLTHVTGELVTLQSTAALLMFLAALRIRWSSSSLLFTLCAYIHTYMLLCNITRARRLNSNDVKHVI